EVEALGLVRQDLLRELRDEANGYAVFESFLTEAAEEAHMKTPYFEAIVPGLVECLDGPYEREYLDPLNS
ncbi:MAG: hypothetical protein AAGJ36_11135, partial [Pseudomonadota bacterium]